MFFNQSNPNGQRIHAWKPKAYSDKIFGQKNEKSHTCEQGGAHFRISFWHLLMNLKNKYLLKKLLKWGNEKQNLNIYNVGFFSKKWKKTPVDIVIKNLWYDL